MARKQKNKKRILPKLCVFGLVLYAVYTLISIQLEVSNLERNISNLESNISKVKLENNELERLLSFGESDEYIEEIAREKLGFCYPDEKILVDRSGS